MSKERALAIKQLQEEALRSLPPNSLYIVLYIRSDPPEPNNFHWGFYSHYNETGGCKYHMRNLGDGWIADHGPTAGVFKSTFLCVLIQIASIPPEKRSLLDQIMRSHDGNTNSIPGMSCRVWLLVILQKLIQQGLVRCNSCEALEQECLEIGNQHSPGASKNHQPRPVVKSKLCD
ncbi:hypothetical protein McanMca71_001940 [Microsporum canis]|uniref:Uncharacterized protein n=1 Tax=Arthroderma otae (strain ATCC MYA-4605 / CBS 113480) TaxID=554155 RepID=C5FX12_ARTOC|nr:conserved hypothetical protein [Microsporum canis CBS 113480]EEQ34852.1 conserved hypothetical protein [Microsporum canis CBS 113480]